MSCAKNQNVAYVDREKKVKSFACFKLEVKAINLRMKNTNPILVVAPGTEETEFSIYTVFLKATDPQYCVIFKSTLLCLQH